MSESITFTITKPEQAELDTLLELWRTEFQRDKEEHEAIATRIEQNSRATKRYLEMIRENLEKPCGKP